VHDDGVPLAREVQQGVELRPGDILSRGFVGEGAIDGDLFELACIIHNGGKAAASRCQRG